MITKLIVVTGCCLVAGLIATVFIPLALANIGIPRDLATGGVAGISVFCAYRVVKSASRAKF
jgi:hypothetical protein